MKTKTKSPTAPPWTLHGDVILGYTVRDANGCLLAEEHSISEAQARLIAAAPDLLAALRHALAFIEHSHAHGDEPIADVDTVTVSTDDGPEMECDLKSLRAALTKATS